MARFTGNNGTAAHTPLSGLDSAARSPEQRSRVTNGKQLFLRLPGTPTEQTAWHRRLKDLIVDHVNDLGGLEATSISEQALIRRSAMMTLQLEIMEARWARNGGEASEKSLITYQRVAGGLRRLLRDLGLKRRARDITPHLQDYLRENYDLGDDNAAGEA